MRQELLQQQALLGDRFLLVLKDYNNQSMTVSLKDFAQSGVDIMTILEQSRQGRIARLDAWLQQSPHMTTNNITFSLQEVQQGTKKVIPWSALEKFEIRQVQSVGTNNYFHFIPMQKGIKKFFQGVPTKQIEAFIAEIDFWRKRGTPPEVVEMAQLHEVEAQQKSKKTMRGLLTVLAVLIVIGIMLVAIVAILMAVL